MARVILLMAILACGLHTARCDTNNKWQPNDNLLRTMDDFNSELISSTHVYTQRQRFLSIVSLAVSYYISSRESTKNSQRVSDAVEKTRRQLDKSTEAIGSVMKALFTLLRSIIDKPINDIKQCCPPNVSQEACEDSLQTLQESNEQYCKEYMRNVRHYNEIVDLFNDKQVSDLTVEISTQKSISDNDALRFFSSVANGNYSKLIKRMRDQYQIQIHTSYPCNALNVPPF